MRLRLLGTGSADGWPNPWCDCASCTWARGGGVVRGQTAILVDDVLLVDCGPDVPRAAARFGVRLSGLRHLLVGHAHPDHLGPESLMWRSWSTAAGRPLDVVAPPAALEVCRAFLARWEGSDPDREGNPLRFLEAVPAGPAEPDRTGEAGGTGTAGGTLWLGEAGARYEVRPLAAHHGDASIGPAVLYDITAPDGTRLLYGCDTAVPLPASTLDAVVDRAYDVVALEENNGDRPGFGEHLGLDTFGELVGELRRRGAIHQGTEILAVHLSHRNPPGDELARRLAHVGARAPHDGESLDITPGPRPTAAVVPRRTLVLGGARSGKSAEAERRLLGEPAVVYVATSAPADASDAEWSARIAAHQARRPAAWTTVESLDLVGLLSTDGPPLLIDGIGLWIAAHLDPPDTPASPDGDGLEARTAELVEAWRNTARRVVAVSDEVGSGVVPATPAGRRFRDALGRANAALAAASDEVCQVIAGIAVPLRP
ncbi:bifunctional adenosylcobinamide kinase/adenosylcobinamide-phosphate guanylyltransferase [Candidatus Frankia nodulisporulans]|uniref:bifunctional adenosylcobinamide kinase/adenosylcobinamide-phosphate guanylyltransferase n=2 Tax=Candidatus Frankia nodulisporulans TaxID=2060052 RepID=UPI0013D88433|nr:bifunctional adenosylcobinamide kinase/adenosylcobinamide-phosphate guanylyltransferase [Candidatus Frankia nodulisporulans]